MESELDDVWPDRGSVSDMWDIWVNRNLIKFKVMRLGVDESSVPSVLACSIRGERGAYCGWLIFIWYMMHSNNFLHCLISSWFGSEFYLLPIGVPRPADEKSLTRARVTWSGGFNGRVEREVWSHSLGREGFVRPGARNSGGVCPSNYYVFIG
jgi:hypothetical protein